MKRGKRFRVGFTKVIIKEKEKKK